MLFTKFITFGSGMPTYPQTLRFVAVDMTQTSEDGTDQGHLSNVTTKTREKAVVWACLVVGARMYFEPPPKMKKTGVGIVYHSFFFLVSILSMNS